MPVTIGPTTCVDGHRQPVQSDLGDRECPVERAGGTRFQRRDRRVVVGVPGFSSSRASLPLGAERCAADMVDVDVVRRDVDEPAERAPLGEVDLLAVAGTEDRVERSRQARVRADGCTSSDRSTVGIRGEAAAIVRPLLERPVDGVTGRGLIRDARRRGPTGSSVVRQAVAVAMSCRSAPQPAAVRATRGRPRSRCSECDVAGGRGLERTIHVHRESDVRRLAQE